MEWVNIPSNGIGGWDHQMQRLGKWGVDKRFLFFSFSEFMVQLKPVPSVANKRGWLVLRSTERLFHMRLRLKN
jgi:hypothetical protein